MSDYILPPLTRVPDSDCVRPGNSLGHVRDTKCLRLCYVGITGRGAVAAYVVRDNSLAYSLAMLQLHLFSMFLPVLTYFSSIFFVSYSQRCGYPLSDDAEALRFFLRRLIKV